MKVLIGKNYTTYKAGLKSLKIDSLEIRRRKPSFAKKCTKHDKLKDYSHRKVKQQMIKRNFKAQKLKDIRTLPFPI